MLNLINSIINTTEITMGTYMICSLTAIVLGLAVAWVHSYKNKTNISILLTIALIPTIVQVIITLVNGNLGTGVAVAGAFGFVRFRSAAGTAREISSLLLAMTIGLATGMGYIFVAIILVLIVGLMTVIIVNLEVESKTKRMLSISVPEALDYEGLFEEILSRYTTGWELISVKTIGMGTMYRLTYEVDLKVADKTRELLDSLRVRNGNLEVSLSRCTDSKEGTIL